MFRKMPFILLGLIVLVALAQPWIPIYVQSFFYGISLSIKSLIVCVLPVIVFGLLFKTAASFTKSASKMVILLMGAICLSNFSSTMISYSVGKLVYCFDLAMTFPSEGHELQPLFVLFFPKWIGNDIAMVTALILGIVLGKYKPLQAVNISKGLEFITAHILSGILYVIPPFMTGFLIKMYHDNVMGSIIHNYGMIFALTAIFVFAYIALIYFLACFRKKPSFFQSLKNMIPAIFTGFGSMSSAAAMPLTLIGTQKNAQDPDLARSIIPATVNVHLIGDCFAIPIFAFAVMKSFAVAEPSFMNYLTFALYFVLAKFSVAAVPGGGILVMLPILERYLAFSPTMLSLITALYILFDPVITSANVLGNGGFAIGLSRLASSYRQLKKANL